MVKASYLNSDHATGVQDRAWTSLNSIFAMNQSLKNFSDDQLAHISLYGSEKFTCSVNAKLLRRTIKFLKQPNTLAAFPYTIIIMYRIWCERYLFQSSSVFCFFFFVKL